MFWLKKKFTGTLKPANILVPKVSKVLGFLLKLLGHIETVGLCNSISHSQDIDTNFVCKGQIIFGHLHFCGCLYFWGCLYFFGHLKFLGSFSFFEFVFIF